MKRLVKISIFIFSFFVFLFMSKAEVKAELLESWGYGATNMDDFLDKLRKDRPNIDNEDDIVVAVYDTGVDTTHPWIQGRIVEKGGATCTWEGCVEGGYHWDYHTIPAFVMQTTAKDKMSHGTSTVGTITKITPDNVKILPINNKGGPKYSPYIEDVVDYVLQKKQEGMNIKIFAYNSAFWPDDICSDYRIEAYTKAVNDLYDAGILFVAAAGNDSMDNTGKYCTAFPDKVIMVSALANIAGKMIFDYTYSNYGSKISFAAPATGTWAPAMGGGFTLFAGTSSATPHLTAQIALMYALCPNCSTQEIEKAMKVAAVDMGDMGRDDHYGYGYIDMNIAYAKLAKGDKPVVTININGAGSLNYSYGAMNWDAWANRNYPFAPNYTNNTQHGISLGVFPGDLFDEMYSEKYFEYREKSKSEKSMLLKNKTIKIQVEMGDELILIPYGKRGFMFDSQFKDIQVEEDKVSKWAFIGSGGFYTLHDIRENIIVNINYNVKFCIFGICF